MNQTKEIKERLSIAEVVGSYIQLKKAGANFSAKCPFHTEKSASFNVSPTRQIWHCFGCGLGGDIFDFVMRIENVEFYDALKLLADKAGVKLELGAGVPEDKNQKTELIRVNTFAAKLYHKLFSEDKRAVVAREYAEARGLDQAVIQEWMIGFGPDDFHFIENALRSKKVQKNIMLDSGLVAQGDKGTYDRFRNRLTFPIFDYLGNIVGFTARSLPGNDAGAKYINSPETLIYNKSKVLFGLYFAKTEIRKQDRVVVVEGQLDCISLHKAGFVPTVATSGTALSEDHIRSLLRLTKNFYFAFDSDTAGQNAMKRAGKLALGLGASVRVVTLPSGKDPDELVRKSPQDFKDAVEHSSWFVEYFIAKAKKDYKAGSVEQVKYVTSEVKPLLDLVLDPIERDLYATKLSEEFRFQKQHLGTGKQLLQEVKTEKEVDTEKLILGGLLLYPQFKEHVKNEIFPEVFSNMYIATLIKDIISGSGEDVTTSKFANEAEFMVELMKQETSEEGVLMALTRAFDSLQLNYLKQSQLALAAEIKEAENQGRKQDLQKLTTTFAVQSKKRLELEKRLF